MKTLEEQKHYIVDTFLRNDFLMSSDLLEQLQQPENVNKAYDYLASSFSATTTFPASFDLNTNILTLLQKTSGIRNIGEPSVILEEQSTPETNTSPKASTHNPLHTKVKVIVSPEVMQKKRNYDDFVQHFRKRYTALQNILMQRRELQEKTLSIKKVAAKKDRDPVAIIGMVRDKQETKNGNLIFVLEDLSGEMKVLVNKTKGELFLKAKEMVYDEVVGIMGKCGDNILFADDIIFPDIPLHKELKKSPTEVYAVFLSDIHFGSHNFLKDEFEKFLSWINGDLGSDKHKEMSSKVGYVFVTGDMIDGVGVYPGQEHELAVTDIYEQYAMAARYLSRIPQHINIIICPGNHDAMRLGEPQPKLYTDLAKPIYDLPNVTVVPNPALVNIHSSDEFPGFDVLMYHGYSYVYFGDAVDALREKGGIDRTENIMRFLLQKRHLAPSYGSALFIPDPQEDHRVISKIPDIFVSGHVHKASISEYRSITLICSSCWQSITSFEEKLGLHPEPARLPILNLQTRKATLLKFGAD